MPFFAYNASTSIYYECHGSGEHAAVLVHGFGDTRETWEAISPYLAPSCRLFLLDLRGSGLSSKPNDSEYGVEDHVRVVMAFLRDRKLNKVSLVGHSFGGAIVLKLALELANQADLKLEKLVLIDSAALPQKIPSLISLPAFPVLGPLIIQYVPARLQAYVSIRPLYKVAHSYSANRFLRYKRSIRSSGGTMALVKTARGIIAGQKATWISGIANLACPTLIFWGAKDPIIPVQHADQLQKMIAQAKLHVVPFCGHIPHEEVPDFVGPLIVNFLVAGS